MFGHLLLSEVTAITYTLYIYFLVRLCPPKFYIFKAKILRPNDELMFYESN